MRVTLVATCLSFACEAVEFSAAPGASIADAVAKARAIGGTNTVTLVVGDWFLEGTDPQKVLLCVSIRYMAKDARIVVYCWQLSFKAKDGK